MATELKARPTEYKGIRFRSKSEAVFARCLDIVNTTYPKICPAYSWIYEAEWDHGHPWDFHLLWNWCGHCYRWDGTLLVEFKPGEPTQTYFSEVRDKVRANAERCADREQWCDSYIVWGSPWKHEPYSFAPVFASRHRRHAFGRLVEDLSAVSRQAMSYRFDLAEEKPKGSFTEDVAYLQQVVAEQRSKLGTE